MTKFDRWFSTFQPQKHHAGINHGVDGYLYETYGKDIEYLQHIPSERLWTVIEADNGKWYISQGVHMVNRVGYIIAAVPYDHTNSAHSKLQEVLYV